MMVEWLAYALAVSLLVSAAAWLAEQGARAQRWPTRWVWAGGLAASVGLPAAAWLLPSAAPSAPSFVGVPTALVLESLPLMVDGARAATGPAPATLALIAWAAASSLLLGFIALVSARLLVRRRGWSRRTVDGVHVWVSRDVGPAALGLIRGHVVVPEWALELDARRRRMLVLHEAEHVRAGDPQLALAGLVVCALAPWNLPLWWQLRRLRLAIETDCDARVLRAAADPRGYGTLLLEVCRRRAALTVAVALAESRSMLERRIRMITKTTNRPATLRAIGLAAVAALVLAVACETPGPTGPADTGGHALTVEDVRQAYGSDGCSPVWFVNGARSSVGVVDALAVDAIASISVFSAEQVRRALDAEVCAIASILTKDATVEEEAAARRLVERLSADRREIATPPPAQTQRTIEELSDGPAFTPMTVRPRLRNPDHVRAELDRLYPPLLKDAGIGGTANVWFFIDTEGNVVRTLINETSGYDAIDAAAQRVARQMQFTPAYNRDERVPVWVALDITFER